MEKGTTSIDTVTVIDDTSIKPFRVDFQQEAIDDLRRRIEMTRWAFAGKCAGRGATDARFLPIARGCDGRGRSLILPTAPPGPAGGSPRSPAPIAKAGGGS